MEPAQLIKALRTISRRSWLTEDDVYARQNDIEKLVRKWEKEEAAPVLAKKPASKKAVVPKRLSEKITARKRSDHDDDGEE